MSQRLASLTKDTDEAIAYTIDWAADVNGSTINTVTWSVPSGITNESTTATTTTSSIRLRGGTPGVTYKIECTVNLADGESLQAHFLLAIQN